MSDEDSLGKNVIRIGPRIEQRQRLSQRKADFAKFNAIFESGDLARVPGNLTLARAKAISASEAFISYADSIDQDSLTLNEWRPAMQNILEFVSEVLSNVVGPCDFNTEKRARDFKGVLFVLRTGIVEKGSTWPLSRMDELVEAGYKSLAILDEILKFGFKDYADEHQKIVSSLQTALQKA